MRIPRFFIPHDSFDPDAQHVTLTERAIVDQILKVLRLGVGDHIDLLDGRGKIYRCSISQVQVPPKTKTKSLLVRIETANESDNLPNLQISIALPILRPARFEWALEKLTELGATEIVPLVTTRSVGRQEKTTRWVSIVREASEQCERPLVPEILAPMAMKEYFAHLGNGPDATVFICVERSHESSPDKHCTPPLHMVLCNLRVLAPHKISVIVGGEGGFTLDELETAQNAGAMPVSLGKLILRSETAAIYTLAVLMAVLDDRGKPR